VRHWLTPDDLVNWLDFLRTTDRRAFVVVEGETDCQALDSHVEPSTAETFPAGGSTAAAGALALLDQRGLQRVLVILDRDWAGALYTKDPSPNVAYTDAYDLDATMMLTRDVLLRVITTHSDRDARSAHLQAVGRDAIDLAVSLAAYVGVLRYAGERDRLGVNCAKFPIAGALSADRAAMEVEVLAKIATNRSPHSSLTEARVAIIVRTEHAAATDRRFFCNGHDLAAVIAALIKHWGGRTSAAGVEAAVRAAFGCEDLQATQLYADVCKWCASVGATVWSCAT
jgi:hypothetical protein